MGIKAILFTFDVKIRNNYIITNNIIGHKYNNNMM